MPKSSPQHIVITGASRGIGLELTKQALEKGHTVCAVARQPENSKGLKELKAKYKDTLELVDAELTSSEATDRIAAALKKWPHVDTLVNNAGIFRPNTDTQSFLESFHVNSVVPFAVTKAVAPWLQKSEKPKAVQITSLMGSIADNSTGGYYAYRASKSALNMINKCLSIELPWLTTIVMHPGWVQTDMGGQEAPVKPKDSAAGIWNVTENLKPTDTAAYLDFRGERLPW